MDRVLTAVERTAQTWRAEAVRRRQITDTDPVADTLDYCAGEIVMLATDAAKPDEWVTVEEYAQLPEIRVTEQTVRAWIRGGHLDARSTTKGYLIRKDARRRAQAG